MHMNTGRMMHAWDKIKYKNTGPTKTNNQKKMQHPNIDQKALRMLALSYSTKVMVKQK